MNLKEIGTFEALLDQISRMRDLLQISRLLRAIANRFEPPFVDAVDI